MYNDRNRNEKPSFLERLFTVKGIATLIICVVLLITGLSVLFSSYFTVQQGEVGIVKTWGQVTNIATEGFHWKNPFADTIEMFDIKVQDAVMVESAGTTDQQAVTTEITVNYHIDPNNVKSVYSRFGHNIEGIVIVPAIQESLKAVTAKYTVLQLTAIREAVKSDVDANVRTKLTSFGVTVDLVSITDFAFSEQYQLAIDNAQTALRNAEGARNELLEKEYIAQQQIITAEAEANATIARANGEATAMIIASQAEANATIIKATALADAQQVISSKLTDIYIQWYAVDQWNGEYPFYYAGEQLGLPTVMTFTNSTLP